MEFNLLSLLGISLAAMFFGYFFGLFEGRGQGYKKRKSEEPVENAAGMPVAAPLPPASAPATEHSLLRLGLDGREQPCLDLDGNRVDASRLAPQQRKRLIDLMLVMRPWVEGASLSSVASRPVTAPPTPIPVSEPRSTPVPVSPAPPPVPESKPATMVGQIDAILQSKILGTPLASKGVRLVELTEGGVLVLVGLSRFEGVADVPDADVQAAIRSAIVDWEEKYTPS